MNKQNQHASSGTMADAVTMVAVDRLGFDVKVSCADTVHGLRIAFTEPVYNTTDVRSMFVSMLHTSAA